MTMSGSSNCEESKSCDVLVTYTNNDKGDVDFTMFGNVSGSKYIALGLSDTDSMSDTSVMFCYYDDISSKTGVGMSWNTDTYNNICLLYTSDAADE